jgi:DNA replication protein DnaC
MTTERRPLVREDLERMALPVDYWRARLAQAPRDAAVLVANYLGRYDELAARGCGLLFLGSPGTGKTALAAVTAKDVRARYRSVFFTSLWDLKEAVRSRASFDADQSVIERARGVDLLVLDNLRVEDAADMVFGARATVELLAFRAQRARPTLVTTRLSFRELDDPKTWKGLLQAGKLVEVPVTGPDLRESQAAHLRQIVSGR